MDDVEPWVGQIKMASRGLHIVCHLGLLTGAAALNPGMDIGMHVWPRKSLGNKPLSHPVEGVEDSLAAAGEATQFRCCSIDRKESGMAMAFQAGMKWTVNRRLGASHLAAGYWFAAQATRRDQ